MGISCFEAETKLKDLGIPAKYYAWQTETNHLYRGKIYNAGASFIVNLSPVSWRCGLSDPTMYHTKPQPLSVEALQIIQEVVDTTNWRLKVSLKKALAFFGEKAELDYWRCQVGDVVRFTNKNAFNCANWRCDYRAKITALEHGNSQRFTYYHAVLLHNNESIRWSKVSYDMSFVVEKEVA
jgi:hypothetical protein